MLPSFGWPSSLRNQAAKSQKLFGQPQESLCNPSPLRRPKASQFRFHRSCYSTLVRSPLFPWTMVCVSMRANRVIFIVRISPLCGSIDGRWSAGATVFSPLLFTWSNGCFCDTIHEDRLLRSPLQDNSQKLQFAPLF